uniref:Wings apart-like protein homolog n=1 Tax=Papio anubis TaxID=9555 RepID=A0A8I5R7X5_PAPAN
MIICFLKFFFTEYETGVKMTSRFGKTYSRKGGNGSSKFDEVFSNKRTTLSTKWGETTFMAKLGQKRPNFKPDIQEIPKKPKVEEESTGDPFGFDSDDESLPVSSKNLAQGKGSSYSESSEAAQLEEVTSVLEANSKISHVVVEDTVISDKCFPLEDTLLGKEKSTNRIVEDDASISSCNKLITSDKVENFHEEREKNSHHIHKNADDSTKKPNAETTVASEIKETNDTWNSQFGKRPESPSEISPIKGSVRTGLYEWDNDFEDIRSEDCILSLDSDPLLEIKDDDFKNRLENLNEAIEEDIVQSVLRPTNCRTYCRANKAKSSQGASNFDKLMDGTSQALAKANSESSKDGLNQAKKGGFVMLPYRILWNAAWMSSLHPLLQIWEKLVVSEKRQTLQLLRPLLDFDLVILNPKRMLNLNFLVLKIMRQEVMKGVLEVLITKLSILALMISVKAKMMKMMTVKWKERQAKKELKQLHHPPCSLPQKAMIIPRTVSLVLTMQVRLSSKEPNQKDDGVFKAPAPPSKVIKTVTIPTQPYQDIVTALKCRREDKELYTVVQHVKHFNDVVEFGENQEFTDDIEYLLSGLKSTQPLNTRCLSVISLATKCAMPSFRMHLRAHGMVAMVFKTLDDSQHHQNLSLCTAALMYILSRDRLNMDLDRASLDLMIRLLELEQDASSAKLLNEKDMNKIKEKIRRLCETVHNKHLDLENITTGHLAMETLLSLTSKRAGDWFKEELRLLGGLDHIVDKVKECVDHLSRDEDEEKLVASLWGAERCLRVLESVTVHNPENQSYLIAYKDSQLIVSSAKALQHCEELIQQYNRAEDSICLADSKPLPHQNVTNHVGKAVEDCMRAIIGVLLNLTNDNEWGSTKTGEQDGLIGTALNCVLQVPKYLPQEQRFDIRVLGLGLLINLVEYSARNRHCLVNMETSCSFDSSICSGEGDGSLRIAGQVHAVQALVQLFLERERAAQLAESKTDELIKDAPTTQHDKSGEWQETSGEIQWVSTEKTDVTEEKHKKEEEDEELDLNKALQHAGKHMEDCIVASYTALLLGCLCQESPINVTTVREYLPEGDFSIMTEMLKKFLSFMNLTCAVGTTGQKSISRVIEYLEHC